MLSKILIAKMINIAHGGTVIGAWEVDGLPDEFITACRALVIELPGMNKGLRAIEKYMEKRRRDHPQYRKYRH